MKTHLDVKINTFQLSSLFDEIEEKFYNHVVTNHIYCSHCYQMANKGVTVDEIYLTPQNDVQVLGRCNRCNGDVGRLFEFGTRVEFKQKALKLRASIKKELA